MIGQNASPDIICLNYNWEISYNYPAKSPGISAELAKIRRYSEILNGIVVLLFNVLITKHSFSPETIVLLFNTLITKHSFISEKLETIFYFAIFSPTHKIT